ncbi:MAG: DHHA1 domain-containing protein [Vicinamibacterales bacterium]
MSTERLYYTQSSLSSFEAVVTGCVQTDAGYEVRLDRTAFYPTSGGQPFDTGMLGGAAVLDVRDAEDGGVIHVVEAPLAPGTVVAGVVDWPRRFDHMQQHTGQHVLSALFDRLHAARTESFHMGAGASTIDLGRQVSPDEIAAAVREANRVVWEDRPVAVRFVTAEEAAALPLRKEPARGGTLRLIDIEDVDLSACGGTHVARTGGIGIIAVSGWEKFRGGTRVEFLCGARALSRFEAWRDALAATQRHLSVAPGELAAGVEKLQAENKALQRAARAFQEQLAAHEARALVERGARDGARVVVVEALEGWDAVGLKALASAATRLEPAAAVALFTAASPALVVVAGGASAGIDAGAVVKALLARFGGRGGGKPDLAQAGSLEGDSRGMIQAATEILSK